SAEIEHALLKTEMLKFSAVEHEKKVLAARPKIMSALMHVLAEFKRLAAQAEDVPLGAGKFSDNYRALCGLLRAYEHTAKKPDGWANAIIEPWHQELSDRESSGTSESLAHVVRKFIDDKRSGADIVREDVQEGLKILPNLASADLQIVELPTGTLYVTTSAALHHWASTNGYRESMPKTPNALGKRLKEISTPELLVVRWEDVGPQRDHTPYKELAANLEASMVLQ